MKPSWKLTVSVALAALIARSVAGTADLTPGVMPADAQKIRAHVKYLASDALEGRGTGQKGGDLAADYIAKEFKSYGLEPAGENGTYFQSVPMVGVKTLDGTAFTLVLEKGQAVVLKNLEDFVTNNSSQQKSADIDAPIVFVGHGITAPEYDWDDYKGVDLKGKVALLFVNEPISTDEKFFKGKALTYYGRWTYKFEETARRGAVATLIIHRTDLASYGWDVVRNSWGSERSYLQLDGTPKLQAASWIQLEVAKKLAGMAGLDLDKLYVDAQSRQFKPVELPVRLKAHVGSELRPFVSRNVIAKLTGADGKLKDEAVLYTAHYDHLGIVPEEKGDNIYNGAVDNATGCGILLELARVWSHVQVKPKRSILFASVTAEEQGLLGSEYLGKHPPVSAGKISLDLNYDALAPIGEPEEVEVGGAERTTFYPVVEKTAKNFKLAIRGDDRPEAGHYYRSDHFSLARVGIPAFSIGQGIKFKGHDEAWGRAQAKDYNEHHYHQPSDEFRESWNFKGLATMARFGVALGQAAANEAHVNGWKPGDEFESARKARYAAMLGETPLLRNLPGLALVQYQPFYYPPLARQARIGGEVMLRVTIDSMGKVDSVSILKGHPLLVQAAADTVKHWQFSNSSGNSLEFELTCEFGLRDKTADNPDEEMFFDAPQHIRIVVNAAAVNTDYSAMK